MPPTDARMADAIEAFAAAPIPKPVSELLDVNGEQMFRTVYPTVAQEQSWRELPQRASTRQGGSGTCKRCHRCVRD